MMTAGSILLGVALFLVVALLVARPFFVAYYRRQELFDRRQALEAEKEGILEQIRQLDFDLETGKVPEDVHQQARAELLGRATAILRQLDQLPPVAAPQPEGNGATGHVDQEIEAAVARLRRQKAGVSGHAGEIEAAVDRLRLEGQNGKGEAAGQGPPTRLRCSKCGRPRDQDDNFCAYCGHRFR